MFKYSVGSLILVNLVPILGVLFLGWNAAAIVALYWFENVVVGFFNVLKMARAEGPTRRFRMRVNGKPRNTQPKAFLIPFFMVHFGMFTFGHGVFVFSLFAKEMPPIGTFFWGALALFISHGVSFFTHFIRNEEYKRISAGELFFQPYKRIVIMHLTIIFGAWLAVSVGLPAMVLVLLVILKIIVDAWAHKKEHKKFSRTPAPNPAA